MQLGTRRVPGVHMWEGDLDHRAEYVAIGVAIDVGVPGVQMWGW